ncbi:MAG: VIT family protein [Stenotrophomonas nitritireducens]|uniref:VIT1/CCC1 transporter family protein n=1 Tax=Stenotrophomonas TaxID=40323 RepID=UPI0006FB1C2E|nr:MULTISPECIES: VIT family protein [Stenotrophomonas]KQN95773.1 nodulin 21 [Stenotrophomonas sp. Leaf70]MBN8793709.1 VIT family protein [Stenotrophomonas nitritireducens]MBN8797426.1 VIT family protein [Stenotrophomonas nitritireducens]
MKRSPHKEVHRSERVGWLRAAVLGANDGIVSVAGLVVGIAASGAPASTVLATGVAGTVAGAMSMAAGEYVSVQSQADTEHADLALERRELHEDPHTELEELAGIYRRRGLSPELAHQVAVQLTAHDALAAHARDELGITEELRARPLQAAVASAGAFIAGATLPVLTALLAPHAHVAQITTVSTLIGLCITGAMAAHAGGAPRLRGALRVMFWGALAMAAAAAIGTLFDTHLAG